MPALLRACPTRGGASRPYLAKIMTPDRVVPFSDVYRYDMSPLQFTSFDDMAAIVDSLKDEPEYCIIRGDCIQPGPAQRRLLREQEDGSKATIVPAPPQHWIMLDIDKRPAEGDLRTNAERLDFLVGKLPSEFHRATYYYKWSSTAGRDGWDYLSCHLWFWMEEAQTCANLHKRASRDGDWFGLVDPSVFTPNQIHYTASPLFAETPDPCEGFRSGIVRKELDAAPVRAWIEPYRPRPVLTSRQVEARTPGRRTEELIADIGVPFYHEAIRAVIAHYVSVAPRLLWDQDRLYSDILDRARARSYVNRDYLNRLWDGAVFKYWQS